MLTKSLLASVVILSAVTVVTSAAYAAPVTVNPVVIGTVYDLVSDGIDGSGDFASAGFVYAHNNPRQPNDARGVIEFDLSGQSIATSNVSLNFDLQVNNVSFGDDISHTLRSNASLGDGALNVADCLVVGTEIAAFSPAAVTTSEVFSISSALLSGILAGGDYLRIGVVMDPMFDTGIYSSLSNITLTIEDAQAVPAPTTTPILAAGIIAIWCFGRRKRII